MICFHYSIVCIFFCRINPTYMWTKTILCSIIENKRGDLMINYSKFSNTENHRLKSLASSFGVPAPIQLMSRSNFSSISAPNPRITRQGEPASFSGFRANRETFAPASSKQGVIARAIWLVPPRMAIFKFTTTLTSGLLNSLHFLIISSGP